jgi:hypothetical protein
MNSMRPPGKGAITRNVTTQEVERLRMEGLQGISCFSLQSKTLNNYREIRTEGREDAR